MSLKEILALKPPDWLIDKVLPEGFSLLYGDTNVGKSFLALDLALRIASGLPFLGREPKKGPVVYVAGEGKGGFGKRVKGWLTAFKGADLSGFRLHPGPLMLDDADDMAALLAECEAVHPRLVIFDTYADCFGGDENAKQDGRIAVDNVRRFWERCGTSVLLLHHTGWNNEHERGAKALRCATDWVVKLCRDHSRLVIKCEKARDFELVNEVAAVKFRTIHLDDGTTTAALDVSQPSQVTSQKNDRTKPRKQGERTTATTVEKLRRAFDAGPSKLMSSKEWIKRSGVPRRSFYAAVKSLVVDGFVQKACTGYYEKRDASRAETASNVLKPSFQAASVPRSEGEAAA